MSPLRGFDPYRRAFFYNCVSPSGLIYLFAGIIIMPPLRGFPAQDMLLFLFCYNHYTPSGLASSLFTLIVEMFVSSCLLAEAFPLHRGFGG